LNGHAPARYERFSGTLSTSIDNPQDRAAVPIMVAPRRGPINKWKPKLLTVHEPPFQRAVSCETSASSSSSSTESEDEEQPPARGRQAASWASPENAHAPLRFSSSPKIAFVPWQPQAPSSPMTMFAGHPQAMVGGLYNSRAVVMAG
jgi:hypothetical protein